MCATFSLRSASGIRSFISTDQLTLSAMCAAVTANSQAVTPIVIRRMSFSLLGEFIPSLKNAFRAFENLTTETLRSRSHSTGSLTPTTQTNHGDTEITESFLMIPIRRAHAKTRRREVEDAMNVEEVQRKRHGFLSSNRLPGQGPKGPGSREAAKNAKGKAGNVRFGAYPHSDFASSRLRVFA